MRQYLMMSMIFVLLLDVLITISHTKDKNSILNGELYLKVNDYEVYELILT